MHVLSTHDVSTAAPAEAPIPVHAPRTLRLLHGPIVRTLLDLAWPNVLVMLTLANTLGIVMPLFIARLLSRDNEAQAEQV